LPPLPAPIFPPQTAAPALPPAPPISDTPRDTYDTIIFPRRDWGKLNNLTSTHFTTLLDRLAAHCASTRSALDTALLHLEALAQMFLATRAPSDRPAILSYLSAHQAAVRAGRSLFAPQDAYRAAITMLGFFVADLIDMLPGKSKAARKRLQKEFDAGMQNATKDEQEVREKLRGFGREMNKGREKGVLEIYLDTVRVRLGNWRREEGQLEELARRYIGEVD
jgi:hypothetical protein